MKTDTSKLNTLQTLDACALVTAQVTSPTNAFNIGASELSALTGATGALVSALDAQRLAEASYRSATLARESALRAAAAALGATARTAIASTATDAQLRTIGFTRPSRGARPESLSAPTGLVAAPFADGTVRLAWERNGNAQGTTFAVEWSADGVGYEMVDTTTRKSLVLSGYAPGTAAWFRVTARRAGLVSPASNVATAYAPGATAAVRLRVA